MNATCISLNEHVPIWTSLLRRVTATCAVAMAALASCSAVAQGIYKWEEYGSFVTSAQRISALNDDAFGDNTSLFTGTVGFSVTDISLPGNSALPVAFSRRFAIESRNQGRGVTPKVFNLGGLFDWDVEVPYLEGVFTSSHGWQTRILSSGGFTPTLNRCSVVSAPYVGTPAGSDAVWSGYNVHIPGETDSKLLLVSPFGTYSAPSDGHTYPWVTKSNMRFRCLPGTANNYPGEAFVGVTSNGTHYYFNWAVERDAQTLKHQSIAVGRKRVYLLATRIEDRFGNWVNFSYDVDRLVLIEANDGRSINLTWTNGRVTSAATNGRTWQYQYEENITGRDGGLSTVILPDGSRWSYAKTGRLWNRVEVNPPPGEECDDIWNTIGGSYGPFTYSVTHPSGATALFNFTQKLIFRINNAQACTGLQPGYYDVWGLDSKTISGPGVPAQTTSYSVEGQPPVSPAHRWTTVTRPDGTQLKFRHGTDYYTNEGKLLQEQTLTAAGVVVKDRSISYIADNEVGPFAGSIGSSMHQWQADEGRVRPIKSTSIALDGATFTTTVNSFDAMARPLSVTRSSSLGFSRTDVTAYQDNTAKWVLGLVTSVTNSNTGLVPSQTTYDPTNAVPTEFYQFGKRRQTLAYHSDGTVYTVKDGADHTTTLTNWKRGIPQSILYADNTTQSAVVDNDGWISSVTDQNSFTTSYGYDSMGRLSSISYPSADDVAWNSSSQLFEQVAAAEYGIPAGHWRKTESTGNARKIAYFDALWRPVVTTEYDASNPGATRRFQRFAYDYANRTTFASYPGTTDALSTGTHTQYDVLGRTTSVSQNSELGSLVTQTAYLPGFQVRVTNPRNYVTLTGYRAYDEPTYDSPVWIQHPEGAFTDISHDTFGKPLGITRRDATSSKSVTRRYVYDTYQQLCKTIDPETGAVVMEYDNAGNLAWSASGLNLPSASSCDRGTAQASGRAVTRTYDSLNRIATLTFPDANGNQSWIYTPDGLPDTVTTYNKEGTSSVTNQHVYNKRRLLKSETLTLPGWSPRTIAYGYDANGFQSTVTYPSALSVSYAPNALGQATQAGSYLSGVSYHPNGAIHQFTYGNGIVHTMTQNARQLPEQVVDSGNVINNTYVYDPAANVEQITDAISASNTRTMIYDGLDRLTAATSTGFGGDGHMRYTYDEMDNLRSAKLSGVKQYNYGYELTTNRLTSITNDGGSSIFGLSYDLQGNVSSKNAQGFTFDYGNRLRESDANGMLVEAYEYDAYGRRVNAWSPNNGNIRSMYGTDGVLRHQLDERAGKAIDYVYFGGSLVARVSTNVAPGSPYVTTDPASIAPAAAYTVQWSNRAGTTSYELQEAIGGGAWANLYSGGSLTHAESSKPAGTYHYRVRACSSLGCSAWSNTRSITVPPAPATAPSLSAPTTGGDGNYSVSWTSITNATSYELEESLNGGAWTSVYAGAQLSTSYSGKTAGAYTYRVKACNGVGCGPVSTTRTVNVIYTPSSAPTIATPAQSAGSYTVTWTNVTGATSYRLDERFNSGTWTQVQDSSALSHPVSGKPAGIYGYRAFACNAAGCSSASAIANTEVLSPLGVPTLSAPANNSTGSYTVSWTSVTSATSYRLDESTNGGSSWTQIQDAASTSASITGRATGSYTYRVRACNAVTCGGVSSFATTQVLLAPAAPSTPSAPANNTTGSYGVSWSAVATATIYRLEESVNSGAWGEIFNASGTSTSLSGRASSTYSYRARACNASGCGQYSDVATTQVLLAPVGAPVVSVPASSYTDSFLVSWTSVAYASSYRLEMSAHGGPWTEIDVSSGTSRNIWSATTGSYSFRARACNTTGCGSYSSAATIQVTLPPAVPSVSVPASSNTGSYTVSWTAVPHATSYRLEESVNGGGWTEVQNAASTSMWLSGRGNGTYGYRVRACNVAGCGGYSATQSITVYLSPDVPASLSVRFYQSGANYRFTATWSAVSGATSYQLQGRYYNGPNTSFSWTVPMSVADLSIEYYVRACDSNGCSGWRGPAYAQQ